MQKAYESALALHYEKEILKIQNLFFSNKISCEKQKEIRKTNLFFSGSRGSRTPDPLLVRQML